MVPHHHDDSRPTDPSTNGDRFDRRRFMALGAGIGASLLAGCSSGEFDGGSDGTGADGGDGTTSTDGDGQTANAGTFRLLISDQPVAIDEFDSLDVSFDRCRVFTADATDEPANTTSTATPIPTSTPVTGTNTTASSTTEPTTAEPMSSAETAPDGEDAEEDGGEADEEVGFVAIDLGGATVDLTQVVGDKAIGVFEGELEARRYSKIELYAADVQGIVDGEEVEVTIPSGKLKIVKPFEVEAGATVSFVFDINVVRKGQSNEYNLLPVIAKSGVAGEEVEVEEVDGDPDGAPEDETGEADETETTATEEDGDGGPPSEAGAPDGDE